MRLHVNAIYVMIIVLTCLCDRLQLAKQLLFIHFFVIKKGRWKDQL
jgi:hypothetical protein